jgi:hypothetical protein
VPSVSYDGSQRMPFGKHQGERLTEVPSAYLEWVLANLTSIRPGLRWAIQQELRWRDGVDEQEEDEEEEPVPLPALVTPILRDWWHSLVRDYHPDRGGSVEVMQALNEAHRRLVEMIENT